MIKILNIRRGFANNSSSSHSIIFDKSITESTGQSEGFFGWGWFELVGDDKMNYLMAQVFQYLPADEDHYVRDLFMQSLFGNRYKKFAHSHDLNAKYTSDIGIDHQSAWALPTNLGNKYPSLEFLKDLQSYIMQDNLVILGGNDNEISLPREGKYLPIRDLGGCWLCRKDGTIWVLFNKTSGTKLSFEFPTDTACFEPPKRLKALTPELVDIKITNYCDRGCDFCYEGSTPSGKYAESLYGIIEALSDLKVFEVSLGGGEPTSHPRFVEILKDFRRVGIIPNFTTRQTDWIMGNDAKHILDLCGSFAFSVSNVDEVENLYSKLLVKFGRDSLTRWSYDNRKFYINLVMGVVDKYDLTHVAKFAEDHMLNLTLLGFKDIGRGSDYKKSWRYVKYDKFLPEFLHRINANGGCFGIGIDTKLAQELGADVLGELGVDERFYYTEEGKFSMYIDAVKERIAPCSYAPETEFKSYGGIHDLTTFIKDTFQTY